MTDNAGTQWLGGSFPPGAVDGNDYIRARLESLDVLPIRTDKPTPLQTPPSLQVITAGATALSKWWAALAAAGIGGSALVQGLAGLGWLPGGSGISDQQQAILTISAAILGSALVLAIAIIVRGDVGARATASAAEYSARASIANALIAGFRYPSATAATNFVLKTKAGDWHPVLGFRSTATGLLAEVETGGPIAAANIDCIFSTQQWDKA